MNEATQGAAVQSATSAQNADAQAVARQAEKYKLKVDNEEVEVDIEELKRGYGHSKAANKRFKEASDKERQVSDLIKRTQSGDLGWLKGLVPDDKLRDFAQKELLQYIEYEALPEHEKELRSERSRRESVEKMLKERDEKEGQEKQQAILTKAYQEIDQDITSVLKDIGKKPTPRLVRRIAEEMLATLEIEDAQPLTAKDAYRKAKHGITQDVTEYLEHADVNDLIKILPKPMLDAIRQQFVDGVIPASIKPRQAARDDAPMRPGKKVRSTSDDFFNKLEKRIGAR